MSKSTMAISKPKRPLSGYNLFYRYKRNMVVEAVTARPNGNDNGHEAKAVIHAVLTASPGLEDVPPDSPAFKLPLTGLNEFRATIIRSAMEGKLFPNENAQNRRHCKVLGIGFVEMSQMIRQMWRQVDKFTKDLFCELADVGRVRYKRLTAEYNLSIKKHAKNVAKSLAANEANTSVVPMENEEVAPTLAAVAINDFANIDAKPNAKVPFNAMIYPMANVAPADTQKIVRPSYGRRVSATMKEIDLCNESLLKPLPVERATGPVAINAFGSLPVETYDASTTQKRSNWHGTELKQIYLRNAIKSIKDKINQNNSLLPSNMRVSLKEETIPPQRLVGERSHLEIMTSSKPSTPFCKYAARNDANLRGSGSNGHAAVHSIPRPFPEKREVSAQDFMEFIEVLDEAIDERSIVTGASEETEDLAPLASPRAIAAAQRTVAMGSISSFVFGRPRFAMPATDSRPASSMQRTVPVCMPVDIQLMTNRARIAQF